MPAQSTPFESGGIVVGADGSEHAERAIAWAAEQAQLEGRRLFLATAAGTPHRRVVDLVGPYDGGDPDTVERLVTAARTIAEDAATAVRKQHPELTVEAVAPLGDARAVLLELAEHAHLLVLGSRGRGTVASTLLGSVSAAVSREAACPVVVCRPGHTGKHARQGVVVAADGTPESRPIIGFGFAVASLRGLPLTVLHCHWDVVGAVAGLRKDFVDLLGDDVPADLQLVLAESIAGFRETYPDVRVEVVASRGLVDEALGAHGGHWDLVVVGRHPMTSVARTLTGSIATTVLERSHSPVAVIPEAAAAVAAD